MLLDSISRFMLFRYQILPINRKDPGTLLGDTEAIADLLAKKNDYFSSGLSRAKALISRKTRVKHRIVHQEADFFLIRIAANRQTHIETEDFTERDVDNWPSILIAVWNDPSKQLIAVQKRPAAFSYPTTPAKMIEDTVNHFLSRQGLRAHMEPLFEESAFWEMVAQNRTRISAIEFELVTPNMSNISASLSEELKALAKSTNTAVTSLEMQADPKAVLDVSPDNEKINSLVEYASKGGGDIALQVKGLKKRLHANKAIKEIEIDNLAISGPPKSVAAILKQIMEDE